jgi:tRNA modification GTPase
MSTIVAISTPRGRGALGIIRLSGADALGITGQISGSSAEVEPRRPVLQNLKDAQTSEIIDQALITYFKAPHSLTGEDVVELSCHGSPVVLRRIIDMALSFGARLAGPGEFTLRALSNGKLNLAQAEAIRDLISSQTEAAARQAARQLNGELAAALEPLKNRLVEVIVLLESAVEFVEDDLPPPQVKVIEESLTFIGDGVEKLARSYGAGHLLQDGIKLTIVGSPNVGKSSLFNKLLERERAIVSDIPGTTRDTLCEPVDIEGVPVLLSDTAGLRETADGIEGLGIQRTHRAMSDADLVMVVVDGSVPTDHEDLRVLTSTQLARRILVLNKCDLPGYQAGSSELLSRGAIRVSALTGEGLDNLRAAILGSFDMTTMESGNLLVTNARHHDLLRHAHRELKDAEVLLGDRESEELVLEPLHNALRFLGEITGETTTEEILSQIFATFCIGK